MGNVSDYHTVKNDEINLNPIDYQRLNESDFKGLNEPIKKTTINVPDGKFLMSKGIDLTKRISPYKNETVVVSSSVGQGKSVCAIELAIRYYRKKYTIIFAVPHKALITEYVKNFGDKYRYIAGLQPPKVPDYEGFDYVDDNTFKNVEVAGKQRLHIMTINCLLGNPGEFTEQANLKRQYINEIINATSARKSKIILFFDEIHDGVHNFKPDLIFNLWKFRTSETLLKAFIFSATFTEASKIVIKYIAELTQKNLHIIETSRVQYSKRLSNLHLHITKAPYYDFNDAEFEELLFKIIDTYDNIDIITYSKKIAIDILNDESSFRIKQKLVEKFKEINLCIAEEHLERLNSKRNSFENVTFSEKYIRGKVNVGTMFKTGISIVKPNNALIIFLPNKIFRQKKNDYGIFSDGIISLTQAMARVRNASDIYVIMPAPNYLIFGDYWKHLPDTNLFKNLIKKTNLVLGSENKENQKIISSYLETSYSEQKQRMWEKYDELYNRVAADINFVNLLQETSERIYLPELRYPSFDTYILEKGENFLTSYFASFGKDISAYIIWTAFNNQFVNCKLKTISTSFVRKIIELEEGKIQDFLFNAYQDYAIELFSKNNLFEPKTCDYNFYDFFSARILSDYEIVILKPTEEKIELSKEKRHSHIMAFLQKFIKGNRRMNEKYFRGSITENDEYKHSPDIPFDKQDYFLCSIANAMKYTGKNGEELLPNTQENNLIETYKNLEKIRQLFIEKLIFQYEGIDDCIYPTFRGYTNPFSDKEISLIKETISCINNDAYFKLIDKNKIKLDDTDKALFSIYNLLKGVFFETSDYRATINEQRVRLLRIDKIIELPQKRTGLNLLYKYQYSRQENYDDDIYTEIMNTEKWEAEQVEQDFQYAINREPTKEEIEKAMAMWERYR